MKKTYYKNKIILVTGGTGSIGSELVRQLLACGPRQVRVYSRSENRQAYLANELGHPSNLRMLIGDVRDYERISFACRGVDVIFHAAAMKHVPACESDPFEAVRTNIIGSQNIIRAAMRNGVKKVVAISTDKVANPQSVMGVSKLMMEKLFVYAGTTFHSEIEGSCVRFGNVAWAECSVFPMWKRQADQRGEILVTDANMTRFLMSISQAVKLTLRAAEIGRGGEIFILKMPAARLSDLAALFLKKYYPGKNIKIRDVGSRGAEKMHEHLIGENDNPRTILENDEMFVIVPAIDIPAMGNLPVHYSGFRAVLSLGEYSSDRHINLKKIAELV